MCRIMIGLNPLIECNCSTVAIVYRLGTGIPVETLLFRKCHMDA